jgi:hypothetical protein
MAQVILSFEDFIRVLNAKSYSSYLDFVQGLHDYMLNNGCKATFEEKKTGLFGSYRHIKSKKSVSNLFLKKQGLFVRIYGENIDKYLDFLNSLPIEMVQSIDDSHICKRLVNNTCSPKCTGYDFTIGNKHFQKCRYGCFEFIVTNKSKKYIKSFVENETNARITI